MIWLLTLILAAWVQVPQPATPGNRSPATPEPDELPEVEETVVVSATRAERRLQDEPLRVEVIDREEIEEKALMTPGSIAMLLGETVGLRVQTTAPSLGATNVRIQGLRGRYSQLLADGLPLYTGDSFSLLQVPPLDLGQVEIIKGAASALYGPAALGGVVNLVARRPRVHEREVLVNVTTRRGFDATYWEAAEPANGWSWTVLAGAHTQPRRDLDADGWTDMAGYIRAVVRPRVFFENGRGTSLFVTGAFIGEDREGGTIDDAVSPDGRAFPEKLDTRRSDVGALGRWLAGQTVVTVRGSFARLQQTRAFGGLGELGARRTWFGEASVSGSAGGHTWVAGAAYQEDVYDPTQAFQSAYAFRTPALFIQDEIVLGARASLAASGRIDVHNEYGRLASPRVSVLLRPDDEWTARLSVGGGSFAPTPFTEVTDETGLSRLAPLAGLRAERARTASADLTWTRGRVEVTGTVFGSRVKDAVQLVDLEDQRDIIPQPFYPVGLVNAPEPTRTWGTELMARYRRGDALMVWTHAYTRSTEFDVESARRRDVPLTPQHTASFVLMYEGDEWGRVGFETYYAGRQALEDNPYRIRSRPYVLFGSLMERRFGRARVFVNVENIGNVRQTRHDPLIRPTRLADGRWTVEAWAPLEGRVVNGGLRVAF